MQTKKGERPLLIITFWFYMYYVKSTKVNEGFGFKAWQLIIIIICFESEQMNCQYETTRVFKIVTITSIAYEYLVFTHCCGWEDRIMRIYDWLYCAVIYHFYWIECCENGATIVPNNQKQPNGMIRMRVYYEIEENNKSIL